MPTGDVRGYIQYHIGASLDAMQEAIAQERLGTFANLVRFFITKAAPVMEKKTVEEIKDLFPGERTFESLPKAQQVGAHVERLNVVVERVLFELREKGFYAFGREEEAGDASGAAIVDDPSPFGAEGPG